MSSCVCLATLASADPYDPHNGMQSLLNRQQVGPQPASLADAFKALADVCMDRDHTDVDALSAAAALVVAADLMASFGRCWRPSTGRCFNQGRQTSVRGRM